MNIEIILQQIEYIMIMVSPFNHKLRIHQFFHNYTCKLLLVIIIFYKIIYGLSKFLQAGRS